jgi:hypothetical protein
MLAQECEVCGATVGPFQVHHVRRLSELDQPGRKEKPLWVKLMASRRRNTLVVCVHVTKRFIGIARHGIRRHNTGKPDEIERLMSGLERACLEKHCDSGNSLALYSTARTILRGPLC